MAENQKLAEPTYGAVSQSAIQEPTNTRSALMLEKPQIGAEAARPKQLSQTAMLFALTALLPVAAGVFAVMAVNQSSIANDQSQIANQIALLALCYANSSTSFCSELLSQADTIVPGLAKKLYDVDSAVSHRGTSSALRDSEGGRAFLLASLITFWVFLGVSLFCTLWYSIDTLLRWWQARSTHKRFHM